MRRLLGFLHHQSEASAEAIAAHARATKISERAEEVYGERRWLLAQNNFAERIRQTYEGTR